MNSQTLLAPTIDHDTHQKYVIELHELSSNLNEVTILSEIIHPPGVTGNVLVKNNTN